MKKLTMLAAAFAAFAAFAETQWWNVNPTQTVERVVSDAGFATTNALRDATNVVVKAVEKFADDTVAEGLAEVSNTVGRLLSYEPLTFRYADDDPERPVVTNSYVLPEFSTARLVFSPTADASSHGSYTGCAELDWVSKRNHVMLIDEIPVGAGYLVVDMGFLCSSNTVANIPAWDDLSGFPGTTGGPGWVCYSNSLPAVLTFVEPRKGFVIVRLDRTEAAPNH